MTVYVVTNVEDGWDCVRGVFSSEQKLAEYFNELKIVHYGEHEYETKDFTGMSYEDIDEFLSDNDSSYVIFKELLN